MNTCAIQILPDEVTIIAEKGDNLLKILRDNGITPEAPCGGNGSCGKCHVLIDGQEVLACQKIIETDLTITLPGNEKTEVLTEGSSVEVKINPQAEGWLLAFDIGTTTVVCYLLDENGKERSVASMLNPQSPYGADVITRIQYALKGDQEILTELIRNGMEKLTCKVCMKEGITPDKIGVLSVVGNPCMQQLFMGLSPENLAKIPFAPVLTSAKTVSAEKYLPACKNAELLVVPDISGYIGADTIGCILATQMDKRKEIRLLVDIGTNGEMVLGNCEHMIACSTAAGPALEGAKIRFGMRGAKGAIDHVYLENGQIRCSVIGECTATGICGSGLIDAVAVFLEAGIINKRGRIRAAEDSPVLGERLKEIDGQRVVFLTEQVYLTQEDIREVQLAKGAIAAGIVMMAEQQEISLSDISEVMLAGAFGNFIRPESACRIGLLPNILEGKIRAVGNAAGSGAKMMACNRDIFQDTSLLLGKTEFLELASLPAFQKCFAKSMSFQPAFSGGDV